MRRKPLFFIVGSFVAFLAVLVSVIASGVVHGAQATPRRGLVPATAIEPLAVTGTEGLSSFLSQNPPPPGAATGPTLTAAAAPIPTCTTMPNGPQPTIAPPTVDPKVPDAAILNTAIARGASSYRPIAKTTDLAPQIPLPDKEMFVIRHTDCTYERYYVSVDQVGAFLHSLGPGDVVDIDGPPSSSHRRTQSATVPTVVTTQPSATPTR